MIIVTNMTAVVVDKEVQIHSIILISLVVGLLSCKNSTQTMRMNLNFTSIVSKQTIMFEKVHKA